MLSELLRFLPPPNSAVFGGWLCQWSGNCLIRKRQLLSKVTGLCNFRSHLITDIKFLMVESFLCHIWTSWISYVRTNSLLEFCAILPVVECSVQQMHVAPNFVGAFQIFSLLKSQIPIWFDASRIVVCHSKDNFLIHFYSFVNWVFLNGAYLL
jgi:hypothetical protein